MIDEIAFLERKKVFKTVKGYIKTNKIGFLEFMEGERDRIYISEKEVLKVFEEIFEYESLEILSEEKKDEINKKLEAKNQQNGIGKNTGSGKKKNIKRYKKNGSEFFKKNNHVTKSEIEAMKKSIVQGNRALIIEVPPGSKIPFTKV